MKFAHSVREDGVEGRGMLSIKSRHIILFTLVTMPLTLFGQNHALKKTPELQWSKSPDVNPAVKNKVCSGYVCFEADNSRMNDNYQLNSSEQRLWRDKHAITDMDNRTPSRVGVELNFPADSND